ncbi:OmpA family protein [Azospirillum soli]|uniref:OmpA family protein n=1 Tax=Azospirillum soli TaxID=1304799 RepID=UPI001AE9D55E|nr:OmpA family protein [Azospirillum soli]MBP2313947.1 outer membrane protein OmpA-like peptidoglycan-associated protein [Azospirillum soli]
MSKTSLRLLSRVALPVLAVACAGPALAQTVEGLGNSKVMMFERPPTVDELRDVVGTPQAPTAGQEQPKIRTRSIEIIGSGVGSAQRPRPTEPANYGGAPTPAPPAMAQPSYSQPNYSQPNYSQPAYTQPPQAQPEPAPQPRPKRQPIQEAAAPPAAPLPTATPRPTQRQSAAQPATMQTGPAAESAMQGQQQQPNAFGFRINFPFNSAEIPRDFYAYIDAVGGLMSQDPSLRLVIEGHTDAIGGDQYNLVLSERRAVSVGEYLVRMHHVEPQRIAIAGMGEAQPLTPDPNDSRNRRVEFKPVR